MICRNCHADVDDDLIFCTNCGERLFEAPEEPPTVLMTEPVYKTPDTAKPPKSSSRLKWLALIIALMAIPASIFGVYLLLNFQPNPQVSQTANKPKTPPPAPTRKSFSNQNSNAANTNTTNTARNSNAAKPADKTEIMNEQIEIAPKSHYDVPFEVEDETAWITGKVKILQGEKIDGFVYFKKNFEENFPDKNFKVFSFGTSNTTEVRQKIVEEDYVLVFVNDTDKPVTIQGNFSLE